MPFRARLKKTFRRNSSTPTAKDGLNQASTNSSQPDISHKRTSDVYQPGERMPPPKYKRPVAKEHKETLEAFSFGSFGRKKSQQSLYSPMGSRMPSYRNSVSTIGGRKSLQPSRANSAVGGAPLKEGVDGEGEEDDTANVGGSKRPSRAPSRQPSHSEQRKKRDRDGGPALAPIQSVLSSAQGTGFGTEENPTPQSADEGRMPTVTVNDTPFSPQELDKALSKTRLVQA